MNAPDPIGIDDPTGPQALEYDEMEFPRDRGDDRDTDADGPKRSRVTLRASRTGSALLTFGVMILCINLRPAVTGMPPIFPQLQSRLDLSATEITLLATIPVVCFGLFSPLAALVGRRFGEERALGAALAAGTVGLLLRAVFPERFLLPGTVIVGGAISFLNVLLPGLIKRREPHRAGRLLSLYMLMLNAGAIAASVVVVPAYHGTSSSLPLTLGLFAVPMAAGLLAWLPQLRHGAPHRAHKHRAAGHPASASAPAAYAPLPRGHVRRHHLAWQVTAFMGLQSLTYYATLSFLPSLFLSRGMPASQSGLVGSLLAVGGVVSSFLVPLVAHRSAGAARLSLIAMVVLCAVGITAAITVPVGVALWLMLLLGLGQGAGISLALYFVMARAATPAVAASLSALAQGVGYIVAALGPLAVGFLHALTGGWTVPMLVLLGVTAAELVVGLLAARPHHVPAP